MKTMKKLLATMFAFALSLSLCVAPTAFAASTHVFDEEGVLSSQEVATLEGMAQDYEDQYGMGVYLYITDTMGYGGNPTESQRNDFARQFYLAHDLGVGSGDDGIIFVIAVESRDYVTVKYIGSGNDPFSDECVDALEEEVTSYLSGNNWYGGSKAYYDTVGEQLEYYAATGKQWTEPDPIGFLLKILATLGIPAGVAGAMVRGEKAAMKTAHERTEANDYLNADSFELSVSDDEFVTTTVVAAPLPKHEDHGGGGGGGWRDMGGGFSGSGGGKF